LLRRASDVQVELRMLDPYVRTSLSHDGAGRFSAVVKVPDVYGVFKWRLDYRRLGYSYIELTGGWGACVRIVLPELHWEEGRGCSWHD
jgi:hypothetical protein